MLLIKLFKNKKIHLVLFYFILSLFLIFAFSRYIHIRQYKLIEKLSILAGCFFNFLVEFCIALIFILLLYQKNVCLRITVIVSVLLFTIILGAQFTSFTMYSDFLVKEAFANSEHIGLLLGWKVILMQVLFLVLAFGLIWMLKFSKLKLWSWQERFSVIKKATLLYGILMVMCCLLFSFVTPDPKPYFPLADSGRSPFVSFVNTVYDFYADTGDISDDVDQAVLNKYSPQLNKNEKFPLLKNWVFKDDLPFQIKKDTSHINVIVFFVESYSARNLSVYNKRLSDITPNLDEFAKSAMVVKKYYNHTAATYRGIQGQLCSMFPYCGGSDGWDHDSCRGKLTSTKLHSVPEVLRPLGYTSTFIGSENEESGGLDEMTKDLLMFDSVFCQEKILAMIGQTEPKGHSKTVSDHQMMEAVISFLKRNTPSKKFFLAGYNLGTHAWFDVPEGEMKYKDGKNAIYNVVHNYDGAFGKFWKYFKASPYYDNTIVILTADHCYPPVDEFVSIAGEDYNPYFVDRIPFIVYDPFHKLPSHYEPGIRTSIDFAPTLLHLLGYNHVSNHFLGRSIFDESSKSPDHFATIGDRSYLICNDKVIAYPQEFELVKEYVDIKSYMNYLYKLELENNLYPQNSQN